MSNAMGEIMIIVVLLVGATIVLRQFYFNYVKKKK
jgi:hypothetical protein